MSGISFKQKGDFSDLTKYLQRLKHIFHNSDLDKYGEEGVRALSAATPVDTGKTADSWYYEVEIKEDVAKITFLNSNVVALIKDN